MMKKLYLFLLFAITTLALKAQHVPSSYYATNPSNGYGTSGAITIDGVITDWSNAKLICQGVANDDPRIFRGSHEGPVYDLYALYASWDATNLYLMWQYTNVTDVSDPAQGFPISGNGKPYNGDIPICIAFDIDPNASTNGLIDGTTNSVWANGTFNTFANGVDHLLMFSAKPGVGQPALFKLNANGKFDYTTTYAIPFTTAGITYKYGDGSFLTNIYGINSNGGSGYVPSNLVSGTYVDFKTLGHSGTQDTFYEMKIPLATLGITQSFLENNGIGAMVISTFGQSGIESLPHDLATLDNATQPYSADASTSAEKSDADNFTVPMARIGHAYVACGVTEIPTVTANPTSILIGSSSTLTATGCATGQTYKWETGQTTAAITVSPTTTTTYKVKCVGTCEGTYSAGTTVTVTCTAPTQTPTVSPSAVTISSGLSTTLTASGCVTGQTYKWSSGQTTASITIAPSTTTSYTAKCVSSTGCEGTSSSAATVTVSGGSATCDNFTWDNATVYFLLLDRFNNGTTSNDGAYGRQSDPAGGFMGGDFNGLRQKITEGYFDNLGVNALWITAPYEQMHGYVNGYGTDPAFQKHYAYHGYYPLDFTQPDAAYGTKAEFKALVDTAHAHGIRMVMDIVMNHLAYDNQGDVNEYLGGFSVTDKTNAGWCNWWGSSWIRKADGYCATTPGGDDLTSSLAGLPDVKTESTSAAANTTAGLPPLLQTKWGASKENRLASEVSSLDAYFTRTGQSRVPRNYIVKWLTDWVREYGIDGFRIDTYKHVERAAWGVLNDEADVALADWKAANPTKKLDDKPFWSVGEWWGHGVGKNTEAVSVGKTDALINFTFKGSAGSPTTIDATYSNYASTLNSDPTWNVLSYISSHDDNMFDRNNLINAGTSLLMAPGAVQIYYGDETARPLGTVASGTDQPTRSFMNWNSINTSVLSHWQKLGKFRKAHPAIGAGTHTQIASSPYTFARQLTTSTGCNTCDKAIVVVGASGSTTVNVSSLFANGTLLKDYYTGNTATVSGGNVTFTAGTNGVILIENPAGCVTCTPPSEIPTASASPSTITYGSSSTLTATGCGSGQTYKWESGQTGASITVSPSAATTTYKVKCVAADGCEGTYSTGTTVTVSNPPSITVYFKKPASWSGAPKAYVWTGTSTAQNGAWPGGTMTQYCGDWYSYEYPSGVTSANIVFNDGVGTALGTNKTPDLTNVSATSYYDGSASMTATTMVAGTPNCTPPTTGVTVYFKRPTSWTVVPKVYAWTGASTAQNGAWPGGAMTQHCGDWYKYTFPSGVSTANVIFNNGTSGVGTNQTPDLLNVSVTSRYDGSTSMSATSLVAGEPTDCPCTPPSAPTLSASPTSVASGGTSTLTATGCAGTVSWYSVITGGTALGTGATFTTPALTTATTYYADCTVNSTCTSTTRSSVTVNITCTPPSAPTLSASPTSVASGGTSTLTATGCAGTVSWYNAVAGGTALGTGTTFTTPALTAATTYYADCTVNSTCTSTTRSSVAVTVTTSNCGSADLTLGTNITTGVVKHETDGKITATNKITGTAANVKYDAKKSVTLEPGFEVNATGNNVFHAYIDGCGNQ